MPEFAETPLTQGHLSTSTPGRAVAAAQTRAAPPATRARSRTRGRRATPILSKGN